jgi:hypothetical protein
VKALSRVGGTRLTLEVRRPLRDRGTVTLVPTTSTTASLSGVLTNVAAGSHEVSLVFECTSGTLESSSNEGDGTAVVLLGSS